MSSADPLDPMYTGPDADLVPGLVSELVEWLRSGDLDAPACARAAMAHLNLVAIHPWRDGNGRTARALHTLLLARLAAEHGLAERTVSALYAAAIGELRRTTYQQDESLSHDQAIRDIQALGRAGLLAAHGHATGRVYALAGAALEISEAAAAAVRGPGRDPYA